MVALGRRWLKSDATVAAIKGLRVFKDPKDLKVPYKMADVSRFMRTFAHDFPCQSGVSD